MLDKDKLSPLGRIAAALPHGFHDAQLFSLRVDIEGGELSFEVAPYLGRDREDAWARKGVLTIGGIKAIHVDAIAFDVRGIPDKRVYLDIGELSERDVMQRFNRQLEPDQVALVVFMGEMNSSIYVVASEASFSWIEQ